MLRLNSLNIVSKSLGIEKAQFIFGEPDLHVPAPAGLPVQIHDLLPVAVNDQTIGGEVPEQVRILRVAAGFVLADHTGDHEPGDLLYQQDLQLAVVGHGLGDGAVAAAVIPAVADADQGEAVVDGFAVDLHHVMPVDALDQVDDGGEVVGTLAGDQGQALVSLQRNLIRLQWHWL